jgi:hypothetical protein
MANLQKKCEEVAGAAAIGIEIRNAASKAKPPPGRWPKVKDA